MYKIFFSILTLFCLLAPTSAHAQNIGSFYCECEFTSAVGSPANSADISNALLFVKTTVNGGYVHRWKPRDSVSICNGSVCIRLVYQANGNFNSLLPVTSDGNVNYKNTNSEKVAVNGYEGPDSVSYTCYRIDYYSNNVYLFSEPAGCELTP
jgi:hypothetical protein